MSHYRALIIKMGVAFILLGVFVALVSELNTISKFFFLFVFVGVFVTIIANLVGSFVVRDMIETRLTFFLFLLWVLGFSIGTQIYVWHFTFWDFGQPILYCVIVLISVVVLLNKLHNREVHPFIITCAFPMHCLMQYLISFRPEEQERMDFIDHIENWWY